LIRTGASKHLGVGLLAVGPDVICLGDIEKISARSWRLHLQHFVKGDVHGVIAFISNFAKTAEQDRYILSNELGDGRVLSGAPSLEKYRGSYILFCPIESAFPRIDAQDLGSSYALQPETNDWYVDEKGLVRVAGLHYLPQKIQAVLSMQRGENLFAPSAGVRFLEFFQEYSGSPWLTWILTLDVVGQASIPFTDTVTGWRYTPLQCVARVRNFELLPERPKGNRVPVRVDLDVQGVGRWRRDLLIYVPTQEQMEGSDTALDRRPQAAVSGSDAAEARPYPNRARWLKQEMATRGISAYGLHQNGGPDRDTTKKILNGCSVRSDALENLIRGLSATGKKVLPAQIPDN
jgi:hypothetical protein